MQVILITVSSEIGFLLEHIQDANEAINVLKQKVFTPVMFNELYKKVENIKQWKSEGIRCEVRENSKDGLSMSRSRITTSQLGYLD